MKRDQLQSWNILSFDPQMTNIDEQIDLVLTLGNMLKQDKQAKMDKFIETMPTIIQTHLIIAPNSTFSEKGDQECPGHDFLMSRSAVRYVSSKSEA